MAGPQIRKRILLAAHLLERQPENLCLDPPRDHEDEAGVYTRALVEAAAGPAATLLELGAGAGHNALYMKRRFRCTLTDISPAMQALSRSLNPDCEHLPGDMRTLRLGRQFDAVFVHDAVCYMTTVDDLRQTAATAFAHTRPGGIALFASMTNIVSGFLITDRMLKMFKKK